jgi:hypothetical protein
MSIPVELAALQEAIESLERAPYLLTVGDDGRAHSVAVDAQWRDGELEAAVGNRTLANASSRPLVTLLWPPDEPGGYSLIVDADVTSTRGTGTGDNVVRVSPTRAVLHRPATTDDSGTAATTDGCSADCEPILDRAATD